MLSSSTALRRLNFGDPAVDCSAFRTSEPEGCSAPWKPPVQFIHTRRNAVALYTAMISMTCARTDSAPLYTALYTAPLIFGPGHGLDWYTWYTRSCAQPFVFRIAVYRGTRAPVHRSHPLFS